LLDLDPPTKLEGLAGVNYAGLSSDLLKDIVSSDTRIEFPAKLPAQGSNNWTISGKLTESGKPLLANDPHRAITLPSLRYIVHLVAPAADGKEAWDVIGAGEPALPGVAIGHNRSIGWGLTIFNIDQQDLYLEQLNPKDPSLYKTEKGWERMRIEKEQIKIKGQAPVEVALKSTRHGPILWEDTKTHRALALRWAGAEPGTSGYLASLALDRADNWEEFLAAMGRWKLPPENFVYADVQGNIGEQSAGLAPRRRWTGLVPVPGDRKYEWQGFRPLEELPRSFNPAAGFVATANHKMIPPNDPNPVAFEWSAPYRFERIRDVLSTARDSGRKLQLGDMQALQNDVLSLPAQRLLKLLSQTPAKDIPAAKELLAWDATLRNASEAEAIYQVWLRRIRYRLAKGTAPENIAASVEAELSMPLMLRWLEHPERAPFARRYTGKPAFDFRNKLLAETLAEAAAELPSLLSLQYSLERMPPWGRLHHVRFRHPLDGRPRGVSFDLGPVGRPGDGFTVNSTSFSSRPVSSKRRLVLDQGADFAQTGGASFREILDLSDWDRSLAINTPGQSGVPGDKHYADLLPLWAEGKYFPLLYSREAIEENLEQRMVLRPGTR
jgi:penicillin amidase